MTRLLDPLRDEDPLPPSRVDIDQAVRIGRRRVRVRWSGAAVIVVVVAVLVPVLGLPGNGGSSVGPATQPELAIDYPEFDPMRRVVEVGDVRGVEPFSYTTARQWQRVNLQIGKSGFATLTVYAPGREATDAEGIMQPETGTPGQPVGGRASYWLSRGSNEVLAWQWAAGAWAFINLQSADDGSEPDRDTMRAIAQAVQVHDKAGEQVAMPFTVPLPAPYQLIGTTTQLRSAGDPFVRTGLLFATEDPADPDRQYSGVSVHVENGSKMAMHAGANQNVDGHPAMVADQEVIIFDAADDFAVDVEGTGEADLLPIARGVQLVPAPSDRSTWVTQPVS
ncbi:hypothetical protein [Actinophytocola sp.]|uniref:hypothetical protein n=1 Tax=Actinophytocola sp. TaxID=1872138 RepID=UPI002ED4FC8E